MTHQLLPFRATEILQIVHLLDNPVVLFSGSQAHESSYAILAFSPRQQQTCHSRSDIRQLAERIQATPSVAKKSTAISDTASPSPRFRSGWAGYFSYEASLHTSNRSHQTPLAEFFYYPVTVELCLQSDRCTLHNPQHLPGSELENWLQQLQQALQQRTNKSASPDNIPQPRHWQPAWHAGQYQQAFERTRHYLRAGDCYQVNLAMPFTCNADLTNASPVPLFERFQPLFGAYFHSRTTTLFSVSPERFIRIQGNRLETRPIKGTIKRGRDAAEDEQHRQWLAASEKNRAENLMIVDLLRNDLSRHAEPFSVTVDQLFHIETHANVHHMVSTISAVKRADVSAADIIIDALPGGSITGAPKLRAMEIIAELEVQPRGPYCGSLGYFDDAGHSDFNILIRIIVARTQCAECRGGGGVVMDSTWEDEWQEIHTKVQRILDTPL